MNKKEHETKVRRETTRTHNNTLDESIYVILRRIEKLKEQVNRYESSIFLIELKDDKSLHQYDKIHQYRKLINVCNEFIYDLKLDIEELHKMKKEVIKDE